MLLEKTYAEYDISLSSTTPLEDDVCDSRVPLNRFKHTSKAETHDLYQWVVCELSDRWRVIVCKDRKQWILQFKESPVQSDKGSSVRTNVLPWRARAYCAFRDSLAREVRDRVGREVSLPDLPEHISDYQL